MEVHFSPDVESQLLQVASANGKDAEQLVKDTVARMLANQHPFNEGARIVADLDWSQCPAVESIPGKVSGAWVFRGTRVPVSAIFENLKTSPMDEVLENFHVTREQIQIVLDFAARSTAATTLQLIVAG